MSLPKDGGLDTTPPAVAALTPSGEPCPAGPDVPREGSRDVQNRGKVISVPHDWCKSTDSPVPYKIWCWQADAGNLANSVRQTDCRSHVQGSYVKVCYGDEPGKGGGIISGTCQAECTLIGGSPTVRAEGRPMGRRFDKWEMNHGNTWGCLENPEDTGNYNAPKVQLITSKMEVNEESPSGTNRLMVAEVDDEDEKAGAPVDPLLGPQHHHFHSGDPAEDEKEERLLRTEQRSLLMLVQRFGLRISQGNALKNAKPKGSALKDDPYHRGASFMRDEAASKGTTFDITGGDGTSYTLTQTPGEMNGVPGRYEYMVDPASNLTHQTFVPNGTINGVPIKP